MADETGIKNAHEVWFRDASDKPVPVAEENGYRLPTQSISIASAGAVVDGSGAIAVADTSQQVFAAKADRKYLFILNIDDLDVLWIDFGVIAVQDQPSIPLNPDDSFVMETNFITNQAVNIIGPNAGSKFVAKEA